MLADKLKEVKKGEVVLFITTAQNYLSTNLKILKYYINKKKNYCIYVSINKPYTTLINLLRKEKINASRLFVIDAVTPVGTGAKRSGNAVFVGSPQALTNISIAATSAIKTMPEGDRVLFLDSVSTLVIYNNTGSVTKFSHFLITKMKEWNIGGAIISIEEETDKKIIAQLSQFCDKVITVKE